MNCQACRKLLTKNRKYCNRQCMAVGYEGRIKRLNVKNSRRQSGKVLKKNCELCGNPAKHVHHRDENPINNTPSNLQSLCVSCHRLSHSPNFMGTATQRKSCRHCSKPSMKGGLCWTHNTRRKKYGDPLLTKKKVGSRFVLQSAAS